MRAANFSVERMAAGGACLRIGVSGARRHRSPRRWHYENTFVGKLSKYP
jgi:hypothetical protein